MPDVRIRPDLSLNYRLEGPQEAPWLVLITGLGGLQEGWFRQVPCFARDFRVLTFDNRGAGRSGVIDAPLTIADLADDTARLFDALGVARAHVWGVSMGGKVAQELALSRPDRVDRLVLENTTAGEAHRVDAFGGRLRGMASLTEEQWLTDVVPLLFGRAYREANAGSMRAFARSRVRHPQDPIGAARQWEAYAAFSSWDRLAKITQRTLVLVGSEDALTDPRNGEALAGRLPNAELAVVAGGHSVHIENFEAVNAVVARFLGAA